MKRFKIYRGQCHYAKAKGHKNGHHPMSGVQ